MKLKLNKSNIDRLPSPEKGQTVYMDSELPGFALRISPKKKTFYVVKKALGRVRWVRIGDYPPETPEMARKSALEFLHKLGAGVDPVQERKAALTEAVTLEEVFKAYTESRKLTPGTLRTYTFVMKALPDWQRKKITDITRDMVLKRFHSISAIHGPAIGNLYGRVLRALFNFAEGQYQNAKGQPLVPSNPVKILSQTRLWNRIERRSRILTPADLPAWVSAVRELADPPGIFPLRETMSNYLLFLLFTGLRESEAKKLRWEDVDLRNRTFTVRDPKNHQDHTLPLSDYLFDLITRQRERTWGSPFVFPGKDPEKPLVEPRKALLAVTKKTGIAFSEHDLRRTFATIAESLDLPWSVLKRLLNHKSGNSDVTSGYIISGVDRLRAPMQAVTDKILSLSNISEGAENG